MNNMIKSIVFDLDDTLYPEKDFQRSGFEAVARFINKKGTFKVTVNKILALNKKYPGKCFDVLIKEKQLPITPDSLIKIYRTHQPSISAFPHLKNVLEKLKTEHKLKLGLLTDTPSESQKNKIRALKIGKFFDVLISTDQINAPKPNSLGYKMLKDKFQCEDSTIIYVGDNEQKDFIGARENGFITVKFKNNNGLYAKTLLDTSHKADYEISNYKELLSIINKLKNK